MRFERAPRKAFLGPTAAAGIGCFVGAMFLLAPMFRSPAPTTLEIAGIAEPTSPAPAGQFFRDCNDVCPEMVVVPTGSFIMGSQKTEMDRGADEGPRRLVSVQSFAASKYEITRGQWAAFAAQTNRPSPRLDCRSINGPYDTWRNPGFEQGENEPVICVNWNDARDYAIWLARRTGHGYRLLTEAEWEYAARAETVTAYPWGESASHQYANYGADSCCSGFASGRDQWFATAPVGQFPANPFGLHDMHGNVWEWVEDCYGGADDGPSDGSAYKANGCWLRVLRGGAWGSRPRHVRSAFRLAGKPTVRSIYGGFRLARTL